MATVCGFPTKGSPARTAARTATSNFLHGQGASIFEREGNDLHCTVPITFTQAVLGDEIDVPTLEGPHKLAIPEGTQSGTELRVKGKGIAEVQGRGRGDLVVRVEVRIPTKLTKEQGCSRN